MVVSKWSNNKNTNLYNLNRCKNLHLIQQNSHACVTLITSFSICRGWALSTLISPLRYLDLHFHNQTTGLSRCIWTPSGTRRTTWTANYLFSFTFANTTGPQSFHIVTLRPHSDDGSKLNKNSIWQFLYNNNLVHLSL